MKRLITVLAIMLVSLGLMWSHAIPADIYDRDEGDDHPWESESSGSPGHYRHSNCNDDFLLSGCLPVDVLFKTGILYEEFRSWLSSEETPAESSSSSTRKDCRIDRTRRTSLK